VTTTPTIAHPGYDRSQCPAWCTDVHRDISGHAEEQSHTRALVKDDLGSVVLYEDVKGSRSLLVDLYSVEATIDHPTPTKLRRVLRAQQQLCDRAADALERIG
jgi:hypothetical protein